MTAQIDFGNTRSGSDAAVVKYIPEGLFLGGGGCGDVGILLAVDVTVFKPCRSSTENEVGGAFNIAVLELDACVGSTGIYRVLIAKNATIDKLQAIACGVKGDSLSQFGSVIFDGDVLDGDVAACHM